MDESNRPRMSTAELLGTTGTWEDSVVGCIVAEVSNRSGVRLGVVSNDAARTIRATVVSPTGSDSRLLAFIAVPAVVHDCAYAELPRATRASRRN
jgi:hypothetical protein